MDSEGHFYEVEQLNTLRPTHRGATIPYAAWLRDGDTLLGLNVPSVPSTKIDKMVGCCLLGRRSSHKSKCNEIWGGVEVADLLPHTGLWVPARCSV